MTDKEKFKDILNDCIFKMDGCLGFNEIERLLEQCIDIVYDEYEREELI